MGSPQAVICACCLFTTLKPSGHINAEKEKKGKETKAKEGRGGKGKAREGRGEEWSGAERSRAEQRREEEKKNPQLKSTPQHAPTYNDVSSMLLVM